MLKSYEAIYDHGKIQWLSNSPPDGRFNIVVVVELPDHLTTDKFGDPQEWQQAQRNDKDSAP